MAPQYPSIPNKGNISYKMPIPLLIPTGPLGNNRRAFCPCLSSLCGFIRPSPRPLSRWHSLRSIDERSLETEGWPTFALLDVSENCNHWFWILQFELHRLIPRVSIAFKWGMNECVFKSGRTQVRKFYSGISFAQDNICLFPLLMYKRKQSEFLRPMWSETLKSSLSSPVLTTQ